MSDVKSSVIFLSNVRLSFPHIAEPQVQQGETGERKTYNCEFILSPNDPGWAAWMQAVMAMAVDKWKEQAQNVINLCQQDRKKRCYGWGQEKINQKTFKVYDGYDGMVFIGAARQAKDGMPQIIDEQGKPVDPANLMACQAIARKLYGGCYVNAAIKPWMQENKHGRGIRCDLVAIQFFADGTPFGEANIDASGLFGAAPAAAGASFAPPSFGAPPAPQQPAAPAWGQPQVPGMPPAPFQGVQAPPMAPPPSFAPPAAPGVPSFLR